MYGWLIGLLMVFTLAKLVAFFFINKSLKEQAEAAKKNAEK